MALNDKCPKCHSPHIWPTDGPYFNDQDECWRDMHCSGCGNNWREYYGITLTEIEEKSE